MTARFIPPVLASLWLPEASTVARRTDYAAAGLIAVSVLLVTALVVVNLYFIIRYRRGSPAPRPPLTIASWKIETFWIAATTIIFLGFFFWGTRIYLDIERPPAGAYEINVIARQWMWDIRQPNGRREFNELHVPTHTPIRLLLTSEDVIHSFFVPAFRLKQDVVPGKQVSLWFNASEEGTFTLFCSEFCGSKHANMTGVIVAESPEKYAAWLAEGDSAQELLARGGLLFGRYGCSGCHTQPSSVKAPSLAGLYGQRVPIAGGGFALVDDGYLRDCILLPGKVAPAGYPLIMPSFQGVIPEGDLVELLAYLKNLGAGDHGGTSPERAP
jgi:cytochrome c oxidase subunit 2